MRVWYHGINVDGVLHPIIFKDAKDAYALAQIINEQYHGVGIHVHKRKAFDSPSDDEINNNEIRIFCLACKHYSLVLRQDIIKCPKCGKGDLDETCNN